MFKILRYAMIDKLKNKLDLLAKKTLPTMVSENIRDDRLNICNSCEHSMKSINVCSKCGCFLPAKTKLARSGCPIGKWHAIAVDIKK